MHDRTRRQVALGAATALALPLAGCLSEDDDDPDEGPGDGNETDDGSDGGMDGDDNETADGMDDNESDDNETDGGMDDNESDDNETDDGFDLGDQYELTVVLETGDGDTVSEGVVVEVDGEGRNVRVDDAAVADGEFSTDMREGEYDVMVEPAEIVIDEDAGETIAQEFEPFEETVTLEEDTEVTATLEGATGDEEVAEQRGDGEDGGNETDE